MFKRILLVTLIVVVTHFAWASYSIYSFGQALRNKDAIALEPKVDWSRLRQSIKSSLMIEMAKQANPDAGTAEQLGNTLGILFADKLIESFVTPAGLARLFSQADSKPGNKPFPVKRYYLNGAPDAINVEFESGVTACFELMGIRWKLVSVWGLDNAQNKQGGALVDAFDHSNGRQESSSDFNRRAHEQEAAKYIEEQREQLDALLSKPKEDPEN